MQGCKGGRRACRACRACRVAAAWLGACLHPTLPLPALPQAARVGEDCEGYRSTSYYETQRRSLDGFMSRPVQVRSVCSRGAARWTGWAVHAWKGVALQRDVAGRLIPAARGCFVWAQAVDDHPPLSPPAAAWRCAEQLPGGTLLSPAGRQVAAACWAEPGAAQHSRAERFPFRIDPSIIARVQRTGGSAPTHSERAPKRH